MHVHSGERSDEMLLKSCDGSFCSIDSMVVQRDELDADLFRPDVFFDCGRTFIVHRVQCQVVAPYFEARSMSCPKTKVAVTRLSSTTTVLSSTSVRLT